MIKPNEDMIILGESMKQMYDGYIRAGFTTEQAISLCKAYVNGAAISTHSK